MENLFGVPRNRSLSRDYVNLIGKTQNNRSWQVEEE